MRTVLPIALAALLTALPARAAELVLVDSPGCYACLQWKAEVGRYYAKTAEARRAPLRRVRASNLRRAYPGIAGVRATPTFILVEDGREIGRFIGYAGQKPFWRALTRLLERR